MPSPSQTDVEVGSYLSRLHGYKIKSFQVLGVNALKSVTPLPDHLAGQTVMGSQVADRTFRIWTAQYTVVVDLQRTGKVIWLTNAESWTATAGGSRPTARLLLENGSGLDLTEPAKTKRISVTLSHRGG